MEFQIVLQGLVIGFAAAATLGPIAILVIQRTLRRGWAYGFASGAGVALADGLFGFAGGLGLTVVTELLLGHQTGLRGVGGVVLVFIGVKGLLAPLEVAAAPKEEGSIGTLGAAAGSVFLLTLSNPFTILFFAAVYAGLSLRGTEPTVGEAAGFSAGVVAGSLVWWLILVSGVNYLRDRFIPERLRWLNRLTGAAIAGFGAWILASVF